MSSCRFHGLAAALALAVVPFAAESQEPPSSWPQSFRTTESLLWLTALDEEGQRRPFVTDGTTRGTGPLVDPETCQPRCGAGFPFSLFDRFGDLTIYSDGSDLWRSDGTPAGTFALNPPELWAVAAFRPAIQRELGFYAFLGAPDSFGPMKLWATDGTVDGTRELADDPGFQGAWDGAALADRLVFVARTAEAGDELWVTDGTPAGTELLSELAPGPDSLSPRSLVSLGGQVFFLAWGPGPQGGVDLWATDGTAGGTRIVVVGHGMPVGDYPIYSSLAVIGDRLVWVSWDGAGDHRLWVSDGTANGTRMVPGLTPLPFEGFTHVYQFVVPFDGRLIFRGSDPAHGEEVWRTDGTITGTRLIEDICAGPCGSSPNFYVWHWQNGVGPAVIVADDGVNGHEPWVVDGDSARLVGDLCPGSCSSLTGPWVPVGDQLFFWWDRRPGALDVWRVPIAGGEPVRLTDFTGAPLFNLRNLLDLGAHAYFPGWDAEHGVELWRSDGTVAGTGLFADLAGGDGEGGEEWLSGAEVPGFEFRVTIRNQAGDEIDGTLEASCIAETLCVSGALPGRSEVFLRVVGPKPNGFLWPTLVKFSTSEVTVDVRRIATGEVKRYVLPGAQPGSTVLPGRFDRFGFGDSAASHLAMTRDLALRSMGQAHPFAWAPLTLESHPAASSVPPPNTSWLTAPGMPGFRFQVRVTSPRGSQPAVRVEDACIGETACVSAALPGRSELFLRVVGPKPNGYFWPTLVRFSTSRVEVWLQQVATGQVRYYDLPAVEEGSDSLDGLFDPLGFQP